MKHYDQTLKCYLIVDAGPMGLGAILAQQQLDGSIRPIAYASRTLSKVEHVSIVKQKRKLLLWYGAVSGSISIFMELTSSYSPITNLWRSFTALKGNRHLEDFAGVSDFNHTIF